jgi:hypothetical protein
MKQLTLYFSDNGSSEIKCLVVRRDKVIAIDNEFPTVIFVKAPLNLYKKFKMLAELTKKSSEDDWKQIHYSFNYNQFNTFMSLV